MRARGAIEMLRQVRIRDPGRVYDLYPHQVSGGMGQRIMIAMMLVAEPELLIADEPTSALDVTVRAQVLAILDDLVTQRGLGLIFISHDLNPRRDLLRSRAGHVRGTDRGEPCRLRARARDHPYTRGLLESLPRLDARASASPCSSAIRVAGGRA
jgi:peptide/nickel transport system ATP-binding protein